MKKTLAIMALLIGLHLNAGLVNAIAISVNDNPITLEDIDKKMIQMNATKDSAISALIDESLYQQSLEKYNINVDNFDIDNYIEKIAKNNKMSSLEFKNAVKQQEDYDGFIEKIKLQLKHQKLISAISANNLIIANEEDLKIYYSNNISQFKIAKKIDAIHYTSKDKNLLEQLKINPLLLDTNLNVKNEVFDIDTVSPQMKYILSQTNEKKFSSIFLENQTYNMVFVSKKDDIKEIPFETIKDGIFNTIMTQRENEYLKNYFEKLKVTAEIKFIK
ncbi:MAG: peptidyl-prolyl cis-trans isomerase [Epsilonproteobacteria bacterium]|nr:peptidyl-prolyl cis-trans isomerase [Campylobacterota bacterium]